jgi:hypothetical protein
MIAVVEIIIISKDFRLEEIFYIKENTIYVYGTCATFTPSRMSWLAAVVLLEPSTTFFVKNFLPLTYNKFHSIEFAVSFYFRKSKEFNFHV